MAQGNIYNALLYKGDLRSAIANLITGTGNDTLIGNDRDNKLIGRRRHRHPRDQRRQRHGERRPGADTIYFGAGPQRSCATTLADLNGDVVHRLRPSASVDVLGARLGRRRSRITRRPQATVSADGSTVELRRRFRRRRRSSWSSPRGSGADAHTDVELSSTYLPGAGGRRERQCDGDQRRRRPGLPDRRRRGALHASSSSRAVSSFANTLGYYKVGGRRHDLQRPRAVRQHARPRRGERTRRSRRAGQRRAHRLLPDPERRQYVGRPARQSFLRDAGTGHRANVNHGIAPVLLSASHGALTGVDIFHSFASLNPDAADPGPVGPGPCRARAADRLRGPAQRHRRQRLPGRRDRRAHQPGRHLHPVAPAPFLLPFLPLLLPCRGRIRRGKATRTRPTFQIMI